MKRLLAVAFLLPLILCGEKRAETAAVSPALKLTPRRIALANGKQFSLNLPEGFDIKVAQDGLRRVRFMALSPDNRIFVTDMYNRADNKRGAVYILTDFDKSAGRFAKRVTYMTGLRNPNSIAFHTDASGRDWFYLALTDRLVRYRYTRGEEKLSGAPEVLATYPDYGLDYKYGGWHLTRTIAIGPNRKLYVSVGSSCNTCEEKEEIRATVTEMDIDGKNQKIIARGVRNAVGLKWARGELFATNMGADHLGDDRPADTLFIVEEGKNYGWPYCYQYQARIIADPRFASSQKKLSCKEVPLAYAAFSAHSSPLGLEYFDDADATPELRNHFLVALHGSSKISLNHGYRVARVAKGGAIDDFVTGFLQGRTINGRPADVLRYGKDGFLLTDDHAGVIYYVFKN
ncbi:MAG TPA: PQQ-dependent sugar dehydrogenase [Blastocatellia bacterium]|nr:PQQ-dependent sugar dehydrogenase [Blastocatellia bacterium]